MTLEEAKAVAKRVEDREYVSGPLAGDGSEYWLDGRFTADELEALAVCLRAGVLASP